MSFTDDTAVLCEDIGWKTLTIKIEKISTNPKIIQIQNIFNKLFKNNIFTLYHLQKQFTYLLTEYQIFSYPYR